MALNKRSRLHKVLLTFDESGKYVTGEALFEEGAWDTDTNDWFGEPVKGEYPITNMTPDGKKFFNDVIGVVAAKALEAAETWKKEAADAKGRAEAYVADANKAHIALADALGARDNFARLHKEAKGDLMNECQRRDEIIASQIALSERIPRLIRKMFGAI